MTLLIALSDNSYYYIGLGVLILIIIIIVAIIAKNKREKHLSSFDSEMDSIIDTMSWSLAREDLDNRSETVQDPMQSESKIDSPVTGKTFEEYKYDVSAYVFNHQSEINEFLQRNGYTDTLKNLTPSDRYTIIAYIRQGYEDEVRQISKRNAASSWLSIESVRKLYGETQGDFVGVYIFHNLNNDKYYVGQAKRVLYRINQHLTGYGNPDLYHDYLNNHTFEVHIIKLVESGYEDLDKLERDLIVKYDSYRSGYNRNSGNGFSEQ